MMRRSPKDSNRNDASFSKRLKTNDASFSKRLKQSIPRSLKDSKQSMPRSLKYIIKNENVIKEIKK